MASSATEWAWANTRASNGSLIVLLAIADQCGDNREVVMTVAQLAAKARLSERAVQDATRDLARLGELSATRVKGGKAYRMLLVDRDIEPAESAPPETVDHITEGAESAPRRICTPAPKGNRRSKPRVQNLHP